ncbi:hypothetical protein EC991_010433, partial [Linnemannia zychae]
VQDIVSAYLQDDKVVAKNTQQETFKTSMRVFVDQLQTRLEPVVIQTPSQTIFDACQHRYDDLMQRYDRWKQTQGHTPRSPVSPQENIVRVRKPRSFNRYRTVESPILVSGSSLPHAAPIPYEHDAPSAAAQQDQGHPPLNRTRIPRNRARYSFKERTRKIVHDPPPKMKQYVLKYYKEHPTTITGQASSNKPKVKNDNDSTITKKPRATKGKQGLVRSMAWHHPTVTLQTGTLLSNTKRIFTPLSAPTSIEPKPATLGPSMPVTTTPALPKTVLDRPDLQRLVVECLQEATHLAAGVKREAQRLIGQFIEVMGKKMDAAETRLMVELQSSTDSMNDAVRNQVAARRDAISDDERRILDHLCGRIKPKEAIDERDDDCEKTNSQDNSDIDDKDETDSTRFLHSFLTFLYSGNYPQIRGKSAESLTGSAGTNLTVNTFINWLVNRKLYHPTRSRGEIDVRMPFTPNFLVRSVSGQLTLELQKIYRNGTFDLYKKAEAMKKKGIMGATVDIQIREGISAAENYLHLNKLTNNSRKIAPFTTSQRPFMSFSERELASFFWARRLLRERLEELA